MSDNKLFIRIYSAILASGICLAAALPAIAEPHKLLAMVTPLPASGALEGLKRQAQLAYQSGQFESSLLLYRQICSATGAGASDFYWMGEAYYQKGQFAYAAQAFEESIKLDSSNDLLRVRLAESYLYGRQTARAKLACDQSLSLVHDERARHQIANLLKISSKPDPQPQRGKFPAFSQIHTERPL